MIRTGWAEYVCLDGRSECQLVVMLMVDINQSARVFSLFIQK